MSPPKILSTLLFTILCVFPFSSFAEIPDSWQAEWNSPSAAMRPLQIIHSGLHPEKMAYYKNDCGLGGIVCNVGPDNYLFNDDQWNALIETVKTAKEIGLRVWIYDEDGYPSPQAGGLTLRGRPDLESMSLVYDAERPGMHVRPAYEHTHASSNHAAMRRYPNLLHPETTQRFLELTHQQYRDRLGEELFGHVEAFFTDEPSTNVLNIGQVPPEVAAKMKQDDPLDPNIKPLPMVPWCDDLCERYEEKYGEDLYPARIWLFTGDTDDAKKTRQQFWELVGELCRDRYYGEIQKWCKENGSSVPTPESPDTPLRIASSGHTLHEEPTHSHVPLDGNKLDVLRRMDVPGLDILSSNPKNVAWGAWRAAAFPASAAWSTGRRLVMTEVCDLVEYLYGSGHVDLETMCATAAWQAAFGVTEFTLYYGIKVPGRDEETHKKYCEYVGRLNAVLRAAKPVYEVALYYPIKELQAEYLPHAEPLDLGKQSAETRRLVANFEDTGRWLVQHQIPFVISDKKPDDLYSYGMFFVETETDARELPSYFKLPSIAPRNDWIYLGRFQRDGRDIFILVNADEEYEGHLVVPGIHSENWSVLNPATGEISSISAMKSVQASVIVPVKLRSKQTLIFVSGE